MNILIVDDHAVVRQGYASLLATLLDDVSVHEAASGEEALQRVAQGCPDLVILDVGLPGVCWRASRSCACCSSACTTSCRWCARRWKPVPAVT